MPSGAAALPLGGCPSTLCVAGDNSNLQPIIHIAGGGLAGSEAAWQIAQAGLHVVLWEMRPVRTTPAHQTDRFAELVCSNSLKSDQHPSASWLRKEELRRLGSFLIAA